jgi:hypothetical protein
MIGIYHGLSGICSHTTGSHLVGSEHHDAVGTHAMAFNLAIILAELLLTDCSSLWPINTRAFVVQCDDRLGASREMRTRSLA